MNRCVTFFLLLVCCAGSLLKAQEPDILLCLDGPARLKSKFAQTNLGKMIQSAKAQELWAEARPFLEEVLPEDTDVDALSEEFLAFKGRLVISVAVWPPDGGLALGESPNLVAKLVISEEQEEKLQRWCDLLQWVLESSWGEEVQELQCEGQAISFVRLDEEDHVDCSLPIMHAGQLLWCISTDLPAALTDHLSGKAADHAADVPDDSFAFRLQVDSLASNFLPTALAELGLEENPIGKLLDDLGVNSLRSFEWSLDPMPPYIREETRLVTKDGNQGLFAALMPDASVRSPFTVMLPMGVDAVMPFYADQAMILSKIRDALAPLSEDLPQTIEGLDQFFLQKFDLRLQEDLLDPLGPHWMRVDKVTFEDDEEEDWEDEEDGFLPSSPKEKFMFRHDDSCMVANLRDAETFARSFDKLVRKLGWHVLRKSDMHGEVKVYRLPLAGLAEVSYAITDQLFLIGLGEGGALALRAVLDEEEHIKKGGLPRPLPPKLAERLALEPKGYYGVGFQDIGGLLGSIAATFETLNESFEELEWQDEEDELAGEPDPWQIICRCVDTLYELQDDYDLGWCLQSIRYQADGIVYRSTQ